MDNKLKRSTLMLSAILLPCLAVAVLLSVIPTRSVQAQIVIYVDDDTCPAPGSGTQATPYCRIQDAVDAAGDGYEIRVAAGAYSGVQSVPVAQWSGVYTYTQVVIITRSLTLRGGYTPDDWYTPDPAANLTIIDAERQGRGVSIVGTYNVDPVVTVDGFTITGGDSTGLGNAPDESNQECAGRGADCGGGFYAYEGAFALRNCIITDNVASHGFGQGGGLYFLHVTAPSFIENTRIISNSAPGSLSVGGGIYAARLSQPLTITNSLFRENYADFSGGGMRLSANIEAPVTILDTDFLSNTAQSDAAGGIYVRLSQNGELLHMDRVRFQNNRAHSRGGAFYLDAAGPYLPKARLSNLLFTGNSLVSATAEDAVVALDGTFTSLEVEMSHVTAVDNSAVTFLSVRSGSDLGEVVTVTVKNALLSFFTNAYAANEVGDGEIVIQHDNTLTQYVTDLHQTVGGSPTFTANHPLTGDPKLSATYHLGFGSAAIDAGTDAGVTTDLDGEPRPNGVAPDIGADEFVNHVIHLPLVVR